MVPPPEFRAWWDVVQRCSGHSARFDAVAWYEVPPGKLVIRGEPAAGAWFPSGNRIALNQEERYGPLVRHEMLHAVLGTGSHPAEYFQSRCRDMILCGRGCEPRPRILDPEPISIEDLDVAIDVFPLAPSLDRDHGRVSVVVWIRNPITTDAYLSPRSYALSTCHVGVFVASVADPIRSAMICDNFGFDGSSVARFRPGETRGIVIDLDLGPEGGNGPFKAGLIAVGVVLGDNVRAIRQLLLRP